LTVNANCTGSLDYLVLSGSILQFQVTGLLY